VTQDGDDDLPRVLRALWGHEEVGRRGPRPGRSVAEIGAAAVRLADAGGLPAVSMSAVAGELGLTTMALYRYLDSKHDLQVVMVDAAYGPPPARRAQGGWRHQLDAWATANRAALALHPWIVAIPVSEPPLAPNQVRWMERGLRAFAKTSLTEQQKLSSLLLLEVFVRGQVLLSTSLDDPAQRGEPDKQSADARYVRRLSGLIDDDFPCLQAALASGSLEDDTDLAEEEFRFGLTTVLDGIAARIERPRR
jgi:AcrR family transcriptional regulator